MMIKAVVFDLDDTLIAGKPMHHAAIIEALKKFKYKRKRVNWIRGATTEEILTRNFPAMDKQTKSKIAVYKRSIVQKYMNFAKIIPGAIKLLRFLKTTGLLVGMVTNNTQNELAHFLKYFKFRQYFDVTVSIDNGKSKPSAEMFYYLMKKTKLKPSEILYVGDSNHDIISCNKAGIKVIISTKIHKASLIKKADFQVKNLRQAFGLIKNKIMSNGFF